MASRYGIDELVGDALGILRQAQSEAAAVRRIATFVSRAAAERSWLQARHFEADAAQGFGVHLLHEEPDHGLWIVAVAWLPNRGAAPHDHGTWAVVAGVDGFETNVYWKRVDDGSKAGFARLEKLNERLVGPGEVVSFLTPAIHSVHNRGRETTVSLHAYGRDLMRVDRSQFDPESCTESPFVLKLQ